MRQLAKEIKFLIQKDLTLEWRQKYALSGILLYVCSTVMVVYMAFMEIEDIAWITVFWIILLFASINAVAKSFLQESAGRRLYYYMLVSPQAVILSKLVYNICLLLVLSALALGAYTLMLGNPVENFDQFLLIIIMGAIAFSLCFTLIAAITAQAKGNATLMPILSFPVIIPILGLLIKLSKGALLGLEDANYWADMGTLLAIDAILIVLSYILFPFLWQD
ncbi:MAG: heme exporter protein CcmB [Chitinophagales bacterium]